MMLGGERSSGASCISLALLATIRMKAPIASSPSSSTIVRARFAGVLGTRRGVGRWCMVRIERTWARLVSTAPTPMESSTASLVEVRLGDIVIHTLPRSWISAGGVVIGLVVSASAATSTTTASTTARVERWLLVKIVKTLLASVARTLALTGASIAHHLVLHLLLHLLQESRIHIGHPCHWVVWGILASALRHLLLHLLHLLHLHHLHHSRVHSPHTHAAVHAHLLLHHGHVLLHSLHVLSHDLGGHTALGHLAGHLVLVATLLLHATLPELAAP